MKTTIPLVITFVMGVIMFFQYFIPHQLSKKFYDLMLDYTQVIGIFALAIGLSSLLRLHWGKIQRRVQGWGYSVVTIVSLFAMAFIGLAFGVQEQDLFMDIYRSVLAPLQSTMFSLLAFYITSAAYRAFRARSWQATVLLVSGVVVMLGRIPIGDLLWEHTSLTARWTMLLPTTAAMRGIRLGVGLGMVATSLKIILGIEKSYLGGGG